ncbi:MAG TPA: zinc ribbon domain-containing protein [Thermoplasmata archaeon]|nr:zinc ribbon domain-containing protein [Thermoplasmata archaeon]
MLSTRRPTFGISTTLFVAVLMLASGLAAVSLTHAVGPSAGTVGAAAPASAPPAVAANPQHASTPAVPVTHGDLVVTSGESYYINSTEGAPVYFQAGNITVDSGGTLYINKVNLSFVQFIGSAGTPKVRLSHIVHFLVDAGGVVKSYNSTITTDMFEINAYPKLNLTVEGAMTLWNSTLAFPGWVNVQGGSASLTLNGSAITNNPSVLDFKEPTALQGAEDFAPTVRASAGGVVNLFASRVSDTFADNLSMNGTPRPTALGVTNERYSNGTPKLNVSVAPGPNENLTILDTANTSAALAQDWLYPSGVTGGEVVVFYNNTGLYTTTADVKVWYNGHGYFLGPVTLQNGTSGGRATAAFTPKLTTAVNTLGLMDYLNFTGLFGVGPAKIAVDLTNITNSGAEILVVSGVFFQLNPPLSYDIEATGAGTHVNSVDTSMDLTFSEPGATAISMHQPYPWLANKLSLTDGANASLGNLTVPHDIPSVFQTSAVLADATSHAYLFRWAAVNLTGLGGLLPVYGGHVTAYYAYNSVQQNNVTANAANDLETWDHPIWQFLQFWDRTNALPAYATSGYGGVSSLLLVSNEITAASLPDGIFMGGYHFLVTIPVASGNSHAFNGSVSPYPVGVAYGTPGYGAPDFAHPQNFPSYFAGVSLTSLSVTVKGLVVAPPIVRIGQDLGFLVEITDTGTAPIFSVAPSIYWNATGLELLNSSSNPVHLTLPGNTYTFRINWTVSEAVTGDHGKFNNTFDLAIGWNDEEASLGGGVLPEPVTVTIEPSYVLVTDGKTPALPIPGGGQTTPINVNSLYQTVGNVTFNGSGSAALFVYLTPFPAGNPILVGESSHLSGAFKINWFTQFSDPTLAQRLTPGTTYTMSIVASYNGQSNTEQIAGEYKDPSPPAAAHNLLTEKILGLPLWMWLAIAGAIVAGLLAFFFVARRQAAGKVVECGECGALVPESATACPKCGADFESDLVRCSRCASTIPANSQFCPECAAQLLGKPGEGGRDPERDGYADFTERFRAEAKKELGENYNEGSFWDWWKRQPTYTSFSTWKLQQQQGAPRGGMMAPPVQSTEAPTPPPRMPPRGSTPPPAAAAPPGDRPSAVRRTVADTPPAPPASGAASTGAAPAASGLKPCPNCRKEIPPEYLVCPFCGSVTQ